MKPKANEWMQSFLNQELEKATFVYSDISDSTYYTIHRTEIEFNFKSLKYHKTESVRLEQNWDVLTKGQSENPPTIDRKWTNSTIEPWTNYKGLGVYVERAEKNRDNWMVFNDLKKILSAYAKTNYSAALNGYLNEDELKWAKKMSKAKDGRTSRIWRQLSFDSKGNVIGVNEEYLASKCTVETKKEQQIMLHNSSGKILKLSLSDSEIPLLMKGVHIGSVDGELIVFNQELNLMLHKFAPDHFPHPEDVKTKYLWAMHKKSKKGLERFEEIAENE